MRMAMLASMLLPFALQHKYNMRKSRRSLLQLNGLPSAASGGAWVRGYLTTEGTELVPTK